MFKKWLFFAIIIIVMTGLFGCANNKPTVASPTQNSSGWTLFASGSQINMLITKGDEIWAATAGGVEVWNRKTGDCRLYTIENGLPENYIWGITQDNSGVIWAVSNFNTCSFDGTAWTTSIQEKITISGFINNHPGNDWVSDATPLIYFSSQDPQLFSPDTLPSNIGFSSMIEDKKGNLWANLSGQGLAYYNGHSWQTFTKADGLSGNTVSSILPDAKGNLWFCTDHGLSYYDGEKWRSFVSDVNFYKQNVIAKDGSLWSTGDVGLLHFTP